MHPDDKERMHEIWREYLEKKTDKDYLTLYIHIPYCTQKCKYCEYFSKVTSTGVPDTCLDYLEEQFQEATAILGREPIKAINFGGGTPNLLSPQQLDRVLKMIPKYWNLETGPQNEMGFEFHPHHMTEEHIEVLRNSYINRISMGIQSFNKHVIDLEHRLYTSKGRLLYIYNTVKSFAKIVNVDLLAGLLDQTSEILLDDVGTLLGIGVEAITIYELNRVHGRNNKESERPYITQLLMDVHERYKDYPDYHYVGTNPQDGFMHCNRLYKNVNTFEVYYNPAPQGFNNVIAFSVDDDSLEKYPYSHFIPLNKAYQRYDNDVTVFYSIDKRVQEDRPWWKDGLDRRAGKIIK